MLLWVIIHLFLQPQAYWPFGPGARAQTKPAPSSGTMIFGICAVLACLVGASIGVRHFLEMNKNGAEAVLTADKRLEPDAQNWYKPMKNGTETLYGATSEPGVAIVSQLGLLDSFLEYYAKGMTNIGFTTAKHNPYENIGGVLNFVQAFYFTVLDWVYDKFVDFMPSLSVTSTAVSWIPARFPLLFSATRVQTTVTTTVHEETHPYVAEYKFLFEAATISAIAIVTTWFIVVLDKINADKGQLNPLRKLADGFLSVSTAALSLVGAVLLTGVYTFDAISWFSAGYHVLFNYPIVFRVLGLLMTTVSLFYFAWIVNLAKSFWEMHTFGVTVACAMALNALLFNVVCEKDVNIAHKASIYSHCFITRGANYNDPPGNAQWNDNWNVLNWEPSFVLFLFFLRSFMHATAELGNALCDRIDGGPDSYFKHGVADIHQVKTAVYNSFDVVLRIIPLGIIWHGVKKLSDERVQEAVGTANAAFTACEKLALDAWPLHKLYNGGNTAFDASIHATHCIALKSWWSPAVRMVKLIDDYWFNSFKMNFLALVATLALWVWRAIEFVVDTVSLARDLLVTNVELTFLVLVLYASTRVAFGADGEGRYNPIGDIKKYLNNAVTTVQENIPVLSAKKEKPAASPKAAPRAGSAKRK